MQISRTRQLAVALVVAVAVTAGGIAYASVPDTNGVIHGCYNANAAAKANGSQLNGTQLCGHSGGVCGQSGGTSAGKQLCGHSVGTGSP